MPQRPKQTDDTTGSPCSPSDTFGRGIVRLLGDRRNLGRFRAIAGQWRATFSGSPRDSPRLHCSHNCHPLYKCPQGTFFIWGQSPRNLGTILARSPRAGRPGCLPQRSRAGLFCGRAQYGPPAGRKGRNLFPVLFVNAGPADGSKFEPIEQFFTFFRCFPSEIIKPIEQTTTSHYWRKRSKCQKLARRAKKIARAVHLNDADRNAESTEFKYPEKWGFTRACFGRYPQRAEGLKCP